MVTRRTLLKNACKGSAALLLGNASMPVSAATAAKRWRMPDEGDPHLRTWMAFGSSSDIWGKDLLPHVQTDLARIALSIARFEPVSMLVRKQDVAAARRLMGSRVTLVECPIDDLWIRDAGPVFVKNVSGDKAAVDFNFNGWGDKQEHKLDAEVAAFVAEASRVERLDTRLVLEGGGIEVDGEGTAIITESCVLNPNRNPGLSKRECEIELKALLGLEKVIWLPGIAGQDITDGHTDFYARFVRPGTVVAAFDPDPYSFDHDVTKEHLDLLRRATDAKGRSVEVAVLQAPAKPRNTYRSKEFAAGYINFYVCNGAVLAPEFGDAKSDQAARGTLARLFPKREVVQVGIDAIAAGGGGIHCATQQEPR